FFNSVLDTLLSNFCEFIYTEYMSVLNNTFCNLNRGFTLIELLIVITIITVMMTIGVVVYIDIGKQTRDSKRLGDLSAITKALELYYAKHQSYPEYPPIDSEGLEGPPGASEQFIQTSLQGYLERYPIDPVNQDPYHYSYQRRSD